MTARIAQSVEQRTENPRVASSNLAPGNFVFEIEDVFSKILFLACLFISPFFSGITRLVYIYCYLNTSIIRNTP